MAAGNDVHRHVAITGASRGIGAQLALAYAAPGRRLALAARDLARLEAVADACRARGATVFADSVDVQDDVGVRAWISAVDGAAPLDLMIANAGVFDGHGPDGRHETSDEARRLIDINLAGTIFTIQAAAEPMRRRGGGHIAVISSLAAILPAADAPTYSACKAGLVAYCDAMRIVLAPDNVRISVVLPGHVKTAQTDIHVGSLAMMLSADQAAGIIKHGLDRGRTFIAFPRTAHWLVWTASVLPWRLKALVTRGDRFCVRKDGG